MFPQCASYRPTEIVEPVRRDESWLWWRQTSPRICLTTCQRFLLLSILICSVNNGGNEEGSLAASRVWWLEREEGGRSSLSWYERVVNQRATKHRPWYVDFLYGHLSLSLFIILLFITTCQPMIYVTRYRGGRIWFFNMRGRKRVYFYWWFQ